MTQQGRGYRAAIPRQNMMWAPYRQRIPYRLYVEAGLYVDGAPIDVHTEHSNVMFFDGAAGQWTTVAEQVFAPSYVLTVAFVYQIAVGSPNAIMRLIFGDDTGGTATAQWVLTPTDGGFSIVGGYPHRDPDNISYVGHFSRLIFPTVFPVIYSEEP